MRRPIAAICVEPIDPTDMLVAGRRGMFDVEAGDTTRNEEGGTRFSDPPRDGRDCGSEGRGADFDPTGVYGAFGMLLRGVPRGIRLVVDAAAGLENAGLWARALCGVT